MTPNHTDNEAEIIYQTIRGEMNKNNLKSISDDIEFAATLRKSAQNIQANPIFKADLETRLQRISPAPRKSIQQLFSGFTKSLIWVTAAVMIVFVVSWSIRTLLPQPLTAATPSTVPSANQNSTPTSTPLPTSTTYGEISAVTPVVKGTAEGDVYTSPIFPNSSIFIKENFPTSPGEAKVYIQNFNKENVVEDGLALAAKLGFSGKAYDVEFEGDKLFSYYVTDGTSRILVFSPYNFYYIPNYQKFMAVPIQDTPITDEQISIAESFLKEHGLLDFPYRIQTEDPTPGSIRFVQLLDDKTISYGNLSNAEITVEVDKTGEINSVRYEKLDFAEAGTYPIISAEEAWKKIQLSEYPEGLDFYTQQISNKINQIWAREYPLGERVELFGPLEILRPAIPSDTPLLFLNNYPLNGDLQELIKNINPSQFMHIWGQFQTDDKGNRFLQVEGWQPSAFQLQTLEGVIQRQGDKGYITVNDKQWLLPELPESIPSDKKLYVNGISLESESIFEWSTITTVMGGGGGGGGGTGFIALNLEKAPTPIPQPTETPYPLPKIGDRVDGVQGSPYVTFFKHTDGSTTLSAYINLKPSAEWPGGLTLNLTGDGLADIEAYHQLPVRIWGSITKINQSIPEVTVERFEPVYPGLKASAWLGTMELVNLGKTSVLLFTDQSGSQYILKTSMESEAKIPSAEVPYIVEGAIYPDQTFEGYPVIHDFAMFPAQGVENLEDYEPHSITPMTLDSSDTHIGSEILTVEKIELVYFTTDLRYTLPDGSMSPVYAQPAWRFYGHYDNGDSFEILVQALTDEYLQ